MVATALYFLNISIHRLMLMKEVESLPERQRKLTHIHNSVIVEEYWNPGKGSNLCNIDCGSPYVQHELCEDSMPRSKQSATKKPQPNPNKNHTEHSTWPLNISRPVFLQCYQNNPSIQLLIWNQILAFQEGCLALNVWVLTENISLFGNFIHFPLMQDTVGSENQPAGVRCSGQESSFFSPRDTSLC